MNQTERQQPGWGQKIAPLLKLPQRYTIAIIVTIGVIIELLLRCCIPYTMPKMAKPIITPETERRAQCPRGPGEETDHSHGGGHYAWSQEMQKIISLSFYVGNLITHVPMGILSDRQGFKLQFFYSVFGSAIIIAIIPAFLDSIGPWGLLVMNILLGLTQGGMNPSLAVLIAHWYPVKERSRFGSITIGSFVIGHLIAEILMRCVLADFKWQNIFYGCAVLGFIWCIVFVIFCYSFPAAHPCISVDERKFLDENLEDLHHTSKAPKIPWKEMLTSLPVWAYIVVHIGHDWVLYGMLLDMPIYMHEVLRFSHTNVIIWSSIPLIVLWISLIAWGFFSDYLLIRNLMNLDDVRKMNTLIACFGPGLFLLFSSYARCQYVLAIIFFTMCMCTVAPFFSGAKLNAIDLSPNYAGTIMGISDGIGSVGAIAPSILNVVTTKSSLSQWRNVFWLDFIVISSSAVIYLLFGTSKVQRWNTITEDSTLSRI